MNLFRSFVFGLCFSFSYAFPQVIYPFPVGLLSDEGTTLFWKFVRSHQEVTGASALGANLDASLQKIQLATRLVKTIINSPLGGSGVYTGTAFYVTVNHKTYLVTAYHVIDDLIEKPVGTVTTRLYDAFNEKFFEVLTKDRVLIYSQQDDYAVLKVVEPPLHTLPILEKTPEAGSGISTVGHAGGFAEMSASLGVVIATFDKRLISSSSVYPGMSGGPSVILNNKGLIEGVIGISSSMGAESNIDLVTYDNVNDRAVIDFNIDIYSLNTILFDSFSFLGKENATENIQQYLKQTLSAFAQEHARKDTGGQVQATSNLWVEFIYKNQLKVIRSDLVQLEKTLQSKDANFNADNFFKNLIELNKKVQTVYQGEQLAAKSPGQFNPTFMTDSHLSKLKADFVSGAIKKEGLSKVVLSFSDAIQVSVEYFDKDSEKETLLFDLLFTGYGDQYQRLAEYLTKGYAAATTFAEMANKVFFLSRSNLVNLRGIPWADIK